MTKLVSILVIIFLAVIIIISFRKRSEKYKYIVPAINVDHCPPGESCQRTGRYAGVCPDSGQPCAIESFKCPCGMKFCSKGLTPDGKHQLGVCIPSVWPDCYTY